MLVVYVFGALFLTRVFAEQPHLWSVRQDNAYDDKLVNATRIWTLYNTDILECARQCKVEELCLSLHYSRVDNTCIALPGRYDGVGVDTVDAPGYLLFQTPIVLTVPGSECAVDEDCASLDNSHCWGGGCVCDIGYASDNTVCVVSACTKASISDHSFEAGTDWADYGEEGWTSVSEEAQDGSKSAKVTDGGAVKEILFSKPIHKLTLSAYSKNVDGPSSIGHQSDYSLYCDLQKENGDNIWGRYMPFTLQDSNWHKVTLIIDETEAFVKARCHLLYRNVNQGAAYFDNIFGSAASDDVTDISQCS